jgi:hypothetical protein
VTKAGCDVRVGTSGWHYDHWRGRFYPEKLPKSRWFEHYAQHFDTWCRPRNYTSTPTPNRTCKFPSIRLSRQL